MKGLSDTIVNLLMIVIVLISVGLVYMYFLSHQFTDSRDLTALYNNEIIRTGQQLSLILYNYNHCKSIFVVEDIGDVKIPVTNITSNCGKVNKYCIICVFLKSKTNCIQPNNIYEIIVYSNVQLKCIIISEPNNISFIQIRA